MSALDRVMARVEAKNFDNRVVTLIKTLRRYKVENQKIDTDDGAVVEMIMSICEELDDIKKILDNHIMTTEIQPADAPDREPCTCKPDVDEGCDNPECKGGTEVPEAMQITIDGDEEPHAEVAEKANPAPKKASTRKKS